MALSLSRETLANAGHSCTLVGLPDCHRLGDKADGMRHPGASRWVKGQIPKRWAVNGALAGPAPAVRASGAGLSMRDGLRWHARQGTPRAMKAQQLCPHSTPHDSPNARLLMLAHPLSRRQDLPEPRGRWGISPGEEERPRAPPLSVALMTAWRMKTAWPAALSWQSECAEVLSRRESSVNRAVTLCVRCVLSSAERPVVAMDMALSLEAYNQGGFKQILMGQYFHKTKNKKQQRERESDRQMEKN